MATLPISGPAPAASSPRQRAARVESHASVVVAVCTRDRPRMLRRCLASIAQLSVPARVAVTAVVVDNASSGRSGETRAIVAACEGAIPVELVEEPRTGIPFARNRALEVAAERGTEAIVFLDDDQTVPPNWLSAIVRVWQEEGADVVDTPCRWEFEGSGRYREFFVRKRDLRAGPPRERWTKVPATNGVLIDRRLWGEHALRFDPAFALSGGSDTAFFKQAARHGAVQFVTRETHAVEHCPREKETPRWILRRAFRIGANKSRLSPGLRTRGRLAARGVGLLLLAGPVSLVAWPLGRAGLRVLCRAARGAGLLAGALGLRVDEYRRIVGG